MKPKLLASFAPWKTQLLWLLSSSMAIGVTTVLPPFEVKHFLFGHSLLELFSVIISLMIFYLGWATYDAKQPGNIFILSILFLSVGLIDLAHLLSYDGMAPFFTPNNPHKAILFWQFSRIVTAISLLLFTLALIPPVRTSLSRLVLLLSTVAATGLIYWVVLRYEHVWPRTIGDGGGLTYYKLSVEYAILALHLINVMWLMWNERSRAPQYASYNTKHAVSALTLLIASEICFTLYSNAYDMINGIGHVFKIIGFIYIFKAVFYENVHQPMIRLIRSERQLRESNQQTRDILQHVHDAVIVADSDGTIVFLNHKAEFWTGWSEHEAYAKHIEMILQIQGKDRLLHELLQSGEGEPSLQRGKMVKQDGVLSDIQYTSTVISGPNGSRFVVIVFRDITEKVASDKHSERLLSILDHAKDFISIADLDGRIVYYNKTAIEMLQLREDEDIRNIRIGETHPEDIACRTLTKALPEAREHGIWRGESVLLSRRGNRIPVSQIIVSHKGESDEVEFYSTIMRDISEWKHAEEENVLAKRVFESIEEGIMVTDRRQTITLVNRAFSSITGYSSKDIVGSTPKILSSGWHNPEFYEAMWSTIRATGTWHGEIWNKKKDGTIYLEELSISRVVDPTGEITHFVGIFKDITVRKELEAKIHYQAHHDILTGLPNRILLDDRIRQAVLYAERNKSKMGIMYIDLDRFKRINDSLGHHIGDKLLQAAAERLNKSVRASDTIARIGGDELIVLLPNLHQREDCTRLADKLQEAIMKPFYIEGHELFITCSIGISIYPDDSTDAEALLKLADQALYDVKDAGRNNYQFYSKPAGPQDDAYALEKSLRKAIVDQQFSVFFQPVMDTLTQEIIGAEALVRWNHPETGIIGPARFIPLAEETGLILQIDRWVLREACRLMKRWHDEGHRDIKVSVNVSMLQFRQPDLIETVQRILTETGLSPSSLVLEITERTMMNDPEASIAKMERLRSHGVNISLDDFGVGYSSFGYLKQLPVNKLKIDRTFVKDITDRGKDLSIVHALISMAHNLNLHVVAEGVEDAEQLSLLLQARCDYVQGYYFNEPLPAEKFASSYLERRLFRQLQ